MPLITMADFLKGRDRKFAEELTEEVYKNARRTVAKASELLSLFGEKRYVTSGWRPRDINKAVGGAPNSLHIYGKAIDFEDKDKRFGKWCVDNVEHLIIIGLWMESLSATHDKAEENGKTPWVHLQTESPRSNNRIFLP